ncbi:MAG TPA: sortase [Acidimicrobiia bacterium]|nr:sortase [Acidimicrobiia bacterium]
MRRSGIGRRRALGVVSLVAGTALAVAATSVLVGGPETPIGEVERTESGLRGPETSPSSTDPPVEEAEPGPTDRPEPAPLWQPNPQSLLVEVNRIDQGPEPVGLRIARISVDAPVGEYGIDIETGQMVVPGNVSEVGWYRYGPKPGEPGSAVLAAHVDLEGYGPGVFFDLGLLEPGDRIEIVYADDTKRVFEVDARTIYPKDELPLDVIFSRDGPPTLTLITCGGDFNSTIASYDSNVVVYARPVRGASPGEGSPS